MTNDEHNDDWLSLDDAAEVIRGYKHMACSNSSDAQMHFDYGLSFMEMGTGLEDYAIKAFQCAVWLQSFWPLTHSSLGLAYASQTGEKQQQKPTSKLSNSNQMRFTLWGLSPTHLYCSVAIRRRNRCRRE